MINKFDLINRNESRYSETKTQDDEKIQETNLNRKRKFNQSMDTSIFSKHNNKLLSTLPTSNQKKKPIESFSQYNYEKKEPIQPSISSEILNQKSLEIIDKYLYLDERFIENDKNIGSTYPQNFIKKQTSDYILKEKIAYPDKIFDIFNHNENNHKFSFSDIFIPLNILYFVQNNIVYFWDYNNGELSIFDQIEYDILNLHITLPMEGIFISKVSYIMIVCTISEVYIILIIKKDNKITFSKSDYVYPIEHNYIITSICSTSERRIFLGSQNDYLYELDYKFTDFFGFNKKAKKITHSSQSFFKKIIPNIFNLSKNNYAHKLVVDNTRHLLYALIYFTDEENIFIQEKVYNTHVVIYDLGENGLSFNKIGVISQAVIKERFIEYRNNTRKDSNFNFLDIFPITRKDSKLYNLVIITKNGIRAYIYFDTDYSNKEFNPNISGIEYRNRPKMKYSIVLKNLPEQPNTTLIENNVIFNSPTHSKYSKSYSNNQIYFKDNSFIMFYKDELINKSLLEIMEYEDTNSIKQEQTYLLNRDIGNREIISSVYKMELNKEIFNINKIYTNNENELNNLLKVIDYDILLPKYINFLDSNSHCSYTCLHRYAKQFFIPPEEFVIMTSSELIFITKLRPIDTLFQTLEHDTNIEQFVHDYGIYETSVMLLNIMINKNFIFYEKCNTINLIQIRNNQNISIKATECFLNLIDKSFLISNKSESQSKEAYDSRNRINIPYNVEKNLNIGQAISHMENTKSNHISYAIFMLLGRISRLFIEEKIYNINTNNSSSSIEGIQLQGIKFIINLIRDFQIVIKGIKEKILQKLSDIDLKMKNMYTNKNISEGNSDFLQVTDFSYIRNEIEEFFLISDRFIETLTFIEFIYSVPTLKKQLLQMKKEKLIEISNLKVKDIIKNPKSYIIKHLIEEFFESAFIEGDPYSVIERLEIMSINCPNIISKSEKELFNANIIIRHCNTNNFDAISKKEKVNKALVMMQTYPENIRLEKTIKLLGELDQIKEVIQICIYKAEYLKNIIDNDAHLQAKYVDYSSYKEGDRMTQYSTQENNLILEEYKKSLYCIFKILNAIHNAIKNDGVDYQTNDPDYIKAVIYDKRNKLNLNQKISLQSDIIEEILKHDMKFLHELLFDHLKAQGLVDKINSLNSPYIENYLNTQIQLDICNPKRYNDLIIFYINSKNYKNAGNNLIHLINYKSDEEGSQSLSLSERSRYFDQFIFCIDKILEVEKNDSERNYYINMKDFVINQFRVLNIQKEILSLLRDIVNAKNVKNIPSICCVGKVAFMDKSKIEVIIYEFDRNRYTLDYLLDFCTSYKIYSIKTKIYFEMFNMMNDLDESIIIENYENHIDYLYSIDNKWPSCIFYMLDEVFITNIKEKTKYQNFYEFTKEKDNQVLINLSEFIKKIEAMNWSIIIKERDVEYELVSNSSYDKEIGYNPLWLEQYLRCIIGLPSSLIYLEYYGIFRVTKDTCELFYYSVLLLQIIKFWCLSVENYINKKYDLNDIYKSRLMNDELEIFNKTRNEISDNLKKIYINFKNNSYKIISDSKTTEKIINFCQSVENKFNAILNIQEITSKKLLNESIRSNISDMNISRINLVDNKISFPSKRNKLEECD